MIRDELSNYELQAMRKLLMLEVSEAAEHIGNVSNRSWQYWESGRSKVPGDVAVDITGYVLVRDALVNRLRDYLSDTENYPLNDVKALKWYHTLKDFHSDFPSQPLVLFRIHQSACAFVFTEGDDITLSNTAEIRKDSMLYEFLSGDYIRIFT